MNLVNQLQVSVEGEDVLTVLRKARRLASKLGVNNINEWLEFEQNGYKVRQEIPDYRIIKSKLVYKTNGYVPAGFGYMMNGISDFGSGNFPIEWPIFDKISQIVVGIGAIKNEGKGIYVPLPNEKIPESYRNCFDPCFSEQISFLIEIDKAQYISIPEAVKDRIMEWALALERQGILGENMEFNDKERNLAQSVVFNISHSRIEQLSNSGKNIKG